MNDSNGSNNGFAQLLTEEWMINRPQSDDGIISLLPSFMETIWMQDTDRYISDGLRAGLEMIRDQVVQPLLHRLIQQQYRAADRPDSNYDATSLQQQSLSKAWNAALFATKLKQWKRTMESEFLRRAIVFLKLWERVLDRFRPELQCWMRYFLERHCLLHSHNCGTLVDFAFGMIRIKTATYNKSEPAGRVQLVPLGKVNRIRLALLQAMIPYLWERFQEYYRNEVQATNAPPLGSHLNMFQVIRTSLLRRRMWIRRLLPILVSIVYGANAFCQFRYLLGLSHFSDLRNTLLGHIVRRVTQQDLPVERATSSLVSSKHLDVERWKPILPTFGWILLASSLSLSWGTQMIHWYREKYQELQQEQLRREQVHLDPKEPRTTHFPAQILPVPLLPPETAFLQSVPRGCCLLCNEPLFSEEGKSNRYPTALNGYIYCYTCIVSHVRQHGICPVTDQKVFDEAKQLIGLYTEMAKT